MTCVRPSTCGEHVLREGTAWSMARMSPNTRLRVVPVPVRTPLGARPPASTQTRLSPSSRSCSWIWVAPPWPMETVKITALVPMAIPSAVRVARRTFRVSARHAIRNAMPSSWRAKRTVVYRRILAHMDTARLGFQTRAVHAGEPPDPVTGAAAPGIVLSTSFVPRQAEVGFSTDVLAEDAPFLYAREGNPTVRQLEAKLASLQGGEAAVAFGSGMAATVALLLRCLSSGDHLVVSDVCYVGVAEFARKTLPRLGV